MNSAERGTSSFWGGRVSQPIGLSSMAVSITVGVVVGGLAGFYGGRAEQTLETVA